MNRIVINLTLSMEEEIDEAIYGGFYSHKRVHLGESDKYAPGMYVQMEAGGEWIPVNDWRHHRYIATEETLVRIAKHFIEIGKRMNQNHEKK